MKKFSIMDVTESVTSDKTTMKDELTYSAVCEKYNKLDALHTDLEAKYKELQKDYTDLVIQMETEIAKVQNELAINKVNTQQMLEDLTNSHHQYERIVQEKANLSIELAKVRDAFEELKKDV